MTAFTRSRPGAPENGRYQHGDTVTDSNGVVWTCAKGGMAGYLGDAVFVASSAGLGSVATAVGAAFVDTVVAAEQISGAVHKTVLTLTDVAQTVVNGTEYQGSQLYTFPVGRILILGCIATLAQKTTSAIAGTLNSGVTGAVALGSVTASSTTLSSTMANILPSTAFTSSTTINVAGTAVSGALASDVQLDGTSTAVKVFLNSAYATTGDVDADATQTFTGSVTLHWVNLGDY